MIFLFNIDINDEQQIQNLEKLYKENRQQMYWIAFNILNDSHLAEDAVQESFVRMIENIEKLTFISAKKQKALISIIVKNIAIDMKRTDKETATDFEMQDYLDKNADLQMPNNINMIHLKNCLEKLPPEYLFPLKLQVVYGYTEDEIGKMLGISTSLVGVRIFRARKKLKELYNSEGK